jgi:hypothetical protein
VTPGPQTYQSFDVLGTYDDVNAASADIAAPPGSISYMMGLFAAPDGAGGKESSSSTPAPPIMESLEQKETTPLLGSPFASWKDSNLDKTPKSNLRSRKMHAAAANGQRVSARHIRLPSLAMPVIEEAPPSRIQLTRTTTGYWQNALDLCKRGAKEAAKPTTLIGSFMYLLYHVVFCLALGSAINRPHSSTSLLGLMTKTAALGTISSSAVYWWFLSSEIPALYPTAVRTLSPLPVGFVFCSIILSYWDYPFSLQRISFWLHFLPTWQPKWTKPFPAITVSAQRTTTLSFWQLSEYWLSLESALVEHF